MLEFFPSAYELPSARECEDYAHYCQTRADAGLGVMPEDLFIEITELQMKRSYHNGNKKFKYDTKFGLCINSCT